MEAKEKRKKKIRIMKTQLNVTRDKSENKKKNIIDRTIGKER